MAILKNTTIDALEEIKLPVGTSAQRPSSAPNGAMRYNSSLNTAEFYSNGSWRYMPDIVRDSLVLHLDAAEPASYPGTGSTWFDLSGNGNNGTLVGSVGYSTSFGGILTLPKTAGTYIDIPSPNLASSNNTVICATRYGSSVGGRIISGYANNYLLGHFGNVVNENNRGSFFAEGWVYQPVGNGGGNVWGVYAGVGNISTDVWQLYDNGIVMAQNGGGSQGPNGFSIGRYRTNDNEYSSAEISLLLAYNRTLSSFEVAQVFQAIRNRYSI